VTESADRPMAKMKVFPLPFNMEGAAPGVFCEGWAEVLNVVVVLEGVVPLDGEGAGVVVTTMGVVAVEMGVSPLGTDMSGTLV
jgi:hypothetical protein